MSGEVFVAEEIALTLRLSNELPRFRHMTREDFHVDGNAY
jgi:hypothetical protein